MKWFLTDTGTKKLFIATNTPIDHAGIIAPDKAEE